MGGAVLDDLPHLEVGDDLFELDSAIWSAENVERLVDDDGFLVTNRALNVSVPAVTTTIDSIAPRDRPVDLILLDIEGAEPYALVGGRETIRRSPNLRLVTEWSASRSQTDAGKAATEAAFSVLSSEGFRPRRVIPKLADDGAMFVSPPIDLDDMLHRVEHSDYVWCRSDQDPWGGTP
jgi:hypothetical protein